MVDHYQLNLGSLRSTITLTLHTHHAARLWQGRAAREGVQPIMGMAGYISATNLMKQASANDDPYADWAMLQVEEKLTQARSGMDTLAQQMGQLRERLPQQIDVSDNLNIQPVTLPLFIGSQLGFLAVYLLTDYDTLVRHALLAHHTALLSRREMEQCIDAGAHLLRSLFTLAQRFKLAGVTRADMAANNARARVVIERLGELPQDVLEGTRRSEFAPPVVKRSSSPEAEDEPAALALPHEETGEEA
ncbi:PFL_4669 family integrating conjugative element protein [Pseudomonas sp. LRF_L74]|uniref:PFL_4669 family integrating conjugative element protein n=1 Tax=Pseudomonas sp. LRF_L74 TaxID=3369422 RepID=UPI003F61A56C